MKWIVRLIINALAAIVAAYLLPGVSIENYLTAILVALALSVLNATLKPILIILTIPFTLITFGLFLLVINAVIILAADALIDGFYVGGFGWALLFSILISILNSIMLGSDKDKENKNKPLND